MLDFRKAIDTVDHSILLSKLANTGVPDFLIRWVTNFLCDRRQRVKIGSTTSSWSHLKAGVPQGTLLGPTSFLLHINDLKIICPAIKYVDDSSIWEVCNRSGNNSRIQTAGNQASTWTDQNNMQLNTDKTKEMRVYYGRKELVLDPITLNGTEIACVEEFKLLGLIINNQLTWGNHVDYICSKASRRIYFLCLLRRAAKSPSDIVAVFCSIVRSVLEYSCEVWHPGLTKQQSATIEHIQKRALRIAYPNLGYEDVLEETGLTTLAQRREDRCRQLFEKMENPTHKLHHLLPPVQIDNRLRNKNKYELPKVRTERNKNSPINYCLFIFQA